MESRFEDPGQFDTTLVPSVTYNFVGNEFVLSKTKTWTKVHDPSSQTFITRVPDSTPVEVQHAVVDASNAQHAWAEVPLAKRRSLMLNLLMVIYQHSAKIRHTLCVEVGKTLADADAEFKRGVDALETACTTINDGVGIHFQHNAAEIHTMTQPLGVCVAICPFNFPFLIPLWSVPYAILAGNTVVLKPSEQTPSAPQILAECFLRAGFPPGVFNMVHGGAGVVNSLLSQQAVRAINFVGSEVAGERIYEHATATRKRIQAECSAKNHGVVLEDASKTKTLYAIAGSAFGAAGQRCMALSVIILVGETREWLDDLISLAESLAVGCGLDPVVDMGPLISPASKNRVKKVIANAEKEGAKIALDGRKRVVADYPDGNFLGPTILTNVKPYMSCYQEEIFGPVLCCIEIDTLEEAIELINANRYGNGCTIFTNSPASAQVFQRSVNVGQVGVNVPILAPSGPILRTGNKDSFLGDQNPHGRTPWQFYTTTKTITSLWH
ncbi:methylmalonate-semialdehyde dehydrogenase [Fusarium solani]|uniref:methylmalonate-semialdehyde dehydrogenase (CoA acylating) n=1 Tax=Fusarium solani TaxID=169388 RepID=A0A9P9GIX0_FUSSL|nr:methylmalonate-semialdehyde dehydrogenase [Fusarium solani]KAH7240393.1 methylmalonate-semialdehyde dehydrogenase [Fusarium solani]